MNIETKLLNEYKEYIEEKSIFGSVVKILPNTPQSFSVFPTIIFKEQENTDYTQGKSTNRQEYMDYFIYQVEIYSKNISLNNNKYISRNIVAELKELTFNFFRQCGFERLTASKGEYIDLTVDRYIMTFSGRINNWNKKII